MAVPISVKATALIIARLTTLMALVVGDHRSRDIDVDVAAELIIGADAPAPSVVVVIKADPAAALHPAVVPAAAKAPCDGLRIEAAVVPLNSIVIIRLH